jgi:tryptophan synthase beta chain
MSREMGGAQIYLKREDLNHTGAHKINNVIGQAMLAKRMGKPRIIAETVPASTAWPRPPSAPVTASNASVRMGAEDVKRQSPNVPHEAAGRHRGAVESGSKT